MIIDTSQGNVEVIGDIKEFKTSIDPRNLEFITTLLSSNLYSNPEESFVREIVSNAWDSHVEAGNTDVPVIIKFKNDNYNKSITIRDYGTGISPKRFKEIYCNIGSSTKRDSNEFIGGFGIGKYSALACTNTTYITSYYNGIAYYYVMIKNGNAITTNLLMEKPTEEKNGVEVTIKNIASLYSYTKALKNIIFFPNIYIDGAHYDSHINEVNNSKIKKFNKFAVSSIALDSKLLLGNVLYPCNNNHFPPGIQDFLRSISYTGIVIKFDVGEVNITPNRESIIYNSDTIKKISNRILEAKKEIEDLIDKKLSKNYDDLDEYYDAIVDKKSYDPITDTIIPLGGYRITEELLEKISFTYKNVDIREENKNIKLLYGLTLPNFRGIIDGDQILIKRVSWKYANNGKLKSKNILMLNENARLSNVAKLYLRDNFNGCGIMSKINKDDFNRFIYCAIRKKDKTPELDLIIEGLYKRLFDKSTYLDLNTDTDFLAYKKELSEDKSTIKTKIIDPIIYTWNKYGYKTKRKFKTLQEAVNFIKELKTGVLLTDMLSDEDTFSTVAKLKGFTYIKARKDIVAELTKLNLTCLVDPVYCIKEDPTLSKVSAMVKYFPNGIPFRYSEVCSTFPENLRKDFDKVMTSYGRFASDLLYRGLAQAVAPDPYIESVCKKASETINKYFSAKGMVDLYGEPNDLLNIAIIIKTKSYRVNQTTYNKFKNNKVLRLLCKK